MSESVPDAVVQGDFYEHWLNVLAQEVFGDELPDNWVAKLAVRVRELNRAASARPNIEAVATIQSSDPYDEREGVWFSAIDLQRLKKLPAGTKLYIAPPPSAPSATRDTERLDWLEKNGLKGWADGFVGQRLDDGSVFVRPWKKSLEGKFLPDLSSGDGLWQADIRTCIDELIRRLDSRADRPKC